MKIIKLLTILLFLKTSILLAQSNDIDNLLEKVNQASTKKDKQALIEKLKQKLANKNKKARQEAEAIIKAKQKIPAKIYNDSSIK
ncbi:hypothetical protein [Poseidonibacter lekithochrous]|uniref:hypothetical protein n=1 Tax=Poseidonibacter lekithochrous TaxID=1904463 RepID=UPI0008FC5432|nr:hypothetical protein [Poseidonibacter lekithochrous]QKJ24025.1 hypothetical protein ALEK_2802 [Poseidonibacter lekithochrous]